MKKFCILLFVIMALFVATAFSQRVVMASYADTITNAQTKYYPAAVQPDLVYGSFQIYIDHLTGTSDSTWVFIQGSTDNATWTNLGSTLYANTVTTTAASPTVFTTCRFADTDAGMIWTVASPLMLPYYRYAVTHYATGTVSVKGYLYKKK